VLTYALEESVLKLTFLKKFCDCKELKKIKKIAALGKKKKKITAVYKN